MLSIHYDASMQNHLNLYFRVAPELFSVTGQPNATHWTMEEGYDKNKRGLYPHRVLSTGHLNGLSLKLYLEPEDLDYLCQGAVQGFKVSLHSPAEIPQPSKNFFRVPLEQQVLVAVKPNVLETSKELQDYSTDKKQCYMKSERTLKFFNNYSQHHCEIECLSNYTAQECGCVHFTYPSNDWTL